MDIIQEYPFRGLTFYVAQREHTITPFIIGGRDGKGNTYNGFWAFKDSESLSTAWYKLTMLLMNN
jgi:hypothetical protein